MIDMELVSVVIPAFNADRYLASTIESVLAQTYQNFEVLIVDDCSTDGTVSLVERYMAKDERINGIFLTKNNGGPAGPRNIGIKKARGAWVAFLDADDLWHPKKLELQLLEIKQTKLGFCSSSVSLFSNENEIQYISKFTGDTQLLDFKMHRFKGRIVNSSVLMKREFLLLHPQDESSQYKAVEDYHCWLRVLEDCSKCLKIRDPLVYYRVIDGQISGSKLDMARKVYRVHSEYPGSNGFKALFYTLTHVLGGFYYRFIRGGL